MYKAALAAWVAFMIGICVAEVGDPVTCTQGVYSYNLPFNMFMLLAITSILTYFACKE